MSFLKNYLEKIRSTGKTDLAVSIEKTINTVVPKYIANFSYRDHVTALLTGEVQSGKTAHMFGLICAAADNGFGIFILLTSDINLLARQTFERAFNDLSDFCVCSADDYVSFRKNITQNSVKRPALIILKKNTNELKKWKNNLAETRICLGNPLFISDDEADAASLNTLVNQERQSTINKRLEEIRKTSSSSIYLEVTGTPQAIFLQSSESGHKPYFAYYFHPGSGYIGGNFYFSAEIPQCIKLTGDDELKDIISDDEFPENGLKHAVITHLLSSAHLLLEGKKTSNCIIHPSMKTETHERFAYKTGAYLNDVISSLSDNFVPELFLEEYNDLLSTKPSLRNYNELCRFISDSLKNNQVRVYVLNSKSSDYDSSAYSSGINIIIGGNSIGRGITIPQLQTVYYCRLTKHPQADTMWQHARMFGYDRDSELVRVFMPHKLFKLFREINAANNNIALQLTKGNGNSEIKIRYPSELRPTRSQVIDKRRTKFYCGGVNYFPFVPSNTSIKDIDDMLALFEDGDYSASVKFVIKLIEMIDTEPEDWDSRTFAGIAASVAAETSFAQARLIVRRNRDIGKGTGTLLSPSDRELGDAYPDNLVLTMYKITGTKTGWNGKQLWIPNIKLPGRYIYYSGDTDGR